MAIRKYGLYVVLGLALFALGGVLGVASGWVRWRKLATSSKVYRAVVIADHARQRPDIATLVVGDSLVERQWLPEFCGPTLNAGIAGATSSELVALTPGFAHLRPSHVVIEVGANDVFQRAPMRLLEENVRALIKSLPPAKIIVMGAPGGGDADEALKRAARDAGGAFVAYPQMTDADTTDGLHMSASGAVKWQDAVRSALRCVR